MADEVAALLECLGLTGVALVGMSLGGSVAQAVTLRHPGLVGALGLVDTTAWYGPGAADAWAGRAQQARTRGLASLAAFQLERWFTGAYRAAQPGRCRELLALFRRNDIDLYAASCAALGAMDLRAGLPGIAVPTSVVVGALDGATPPAHAEALARAVEGASLTVVPECKHLSAVERPGDVVEALRPVLGAAVPGHDRTHRTREGADRR
jgi:3-oxoadipate enol-lactonase